jgi:replication factor C large subunit
VILIVNDLYALSKKSSVIKSETLQITFSRPRIDVIVRALDTIAKCENVSVDQEALRKMAENSNGDMRAAVRNLESLSLGRSKVTDEDADKLSDRIIRKDIYDLMNSIFRGKDASVARRMMRDVDETPDHIMMWIDENMPYEFTDKGDLIRGYERLSRADIFMGRVSRRQYYGFWSYAGDMMSSGVNIARRSEVTSRERFRFPLYLMKMSRSKSVRALKGSVCMKLSSLLHTSTSRISNDVLPSLKIMLKNDAALARCLVNDADLEAEEIAFLLDAKIDSKAVKDATAPAANSRSTEPEPVDEPTADATESKNDVQPASQKSLFQF